MHRVLKPGGRPAIQDVAQGQGGPIDFPVMWADRAEISFLRAPEGMRAMLEAAGFQVRHWIDNTDVARAEAAAERMRMGVDGDPATPPVLDIHVPVLGIHVIVGPRFRDTMRHAGKAQAEDRLRLLNVVLVRT